MTTKAAKQFRQGELNVYSTPKAVAEVTQALRHTGRRVTLVPTMGALHNGHLALVRAAKRVPGSVVVVSIFVNPLQFGPGEDFDSYPRTMDDDLNLLRERGVEVVFAPRVEAMYPDGMRTMVQAGPLGAELEGAMRPSHFAGMLTVVLKLLQIVRPDRAFFGEKDYQQLVLIRQMVADLNIDVRIEGVPIVREPDGLALSSRNRYLTPIEREQAGALSAALLAGMYAASGGVAATLGRRPRGPGRGTRNSRRLSAGSRAGSGARARRRAGPPAGGRPAWLHPTLGQHRDQYRRHRRSFRRRAGRPSRITLEELMLRTMLKSKIHRATVTQADLHYVGSVTIDADLMDAADLLEGEQVTIVDIANGARLVTYAITGERGSGVIGINGAAAHLVHPGDLVIIIAYGTMEDAEARGYRPRIVFVDADNRQVDLGPNGHDPAFAPDHYDLVSPR